MTHTKDIFRNLFGGLIILSAVSTLALATGAQAADIYVADDSNTGSAKIEVTVENISVPEGALKVALYDSEADYKAGEIVRAADAAVDGAQVTFTFEGLADGEYAIAIYHDANDDGEMNTNPFGMPTEQFGFSNNAMGRMGPPSWRASSFSVEGQAEQTITMN